MPETITAMEMAKSAGISPKRFRAALRAQRFSWHAANHPWIVPKGGSEHEDMQRVLANLMRQP
jgi:hypothetical protein